MNEKRVNQNKTRDQDKKLKDALAKKPTVSNLNHLGMNPNQYVEFLAKQKEIKKTFLESGRIKNAKKQVLHNKRPKTLSSIHDLDLAFMNPPKTHKYDSVECDVPSWFRNTKSVDVSIIIPMYKSEGVIEDLINSFPLNNKNTWEIIFVDDVCPNNSKQKVIDYWIKRKDELKCPIGKIIKNQSNLGYGGSCNVGASNALGKHLIFLNADTTLTENWLDPMIELHKDPTVGIVGNMQLKEGGNLHGTIDSAGSEWLWHARSFVHIARHCYKRKDISLPYYIDNCPQDVLEVSEREMVTGCCFSIPKELFDYIGGFNPNYQIGYWEDSEMCMNIKELGYKVMFQPNSVIYHKLGHTKSGSHPYHKSNEKYFENKWVKSQRLDKLLFDDGKRKNKEAINSILIQRTNAHGDVLVASGVCKAIKKEHPNTKLIFATLYPDVLKNNPYIDEVIQIKDIKQSMFDVFYNLDSAYENRPKINILTSYAEMVGVKKEDCEVYLHKEEIENLPENYVVIHPGRTDWIGRDLPQKVLSELSERLIKKGMNVVVIGNYTEFDIPSTLNLKGKTTIHQMAYVISKAKAFVGIDSFPMHVAQAVKTPGICFFGCIKPESRIYTDTMKGITATGLSCLGCHHKKPAPQYVTKTCEMGDPICTKLVSANTMLYELKNILEKQIENNSILG
jgi:ADP-heptose:LPS heptosyltransferase/GT2 family glycosyltransferase